MQELRLAKFVTEGETSSYLAASAIEAMKILLANDETPDAIILYDLRDRDFVLGDRNIHIHCVDEQGRINVDVAPKDVLARLPGLSGSPALVDAIYAAHVEVKEDLFLCNGMTEEIYGQLKELVTACGLGVVNINTASPEVFSAQGMDADLIRKIQQYRAGDDGQEGTPDDKYFSKPADIIAILAAYNLAPAQLQTLQYLLSSAQLGTTSNHVALEITVKKGLKKERFFRIVMDPASGKVASWSEE